MTCRTQTMSVSLKFCSQQCCQARSSFLTLGPSSPSLPFALLAVCRFRNGPVPQPNTAAQGLPLVKSIIWAAVAGRERAWLRSGPPASALQARRLSRGSGVPARARPNQATRVRPFGPQTGIRAASRATPCGYPPSSGSDRRLRSSATPQARCESREVRRKRPRTTPPARARASFA